MTPSPAIADAAALFYPASPVAWEAKAAVATARGDAEGAELARIEAVAAGGAAHHLAGLGQVVEGRASATSKAAGGRIVANRTGG